MGYVRVPYGSRNTNANRTDIMEAPRLYPEGVITPTVCFLLVQTIKLTLLQF